MSTDQTDPRPRGSWDFPPRWLCVSQIVLGIWLATSGVLRLQKADPGIYGHVPDWMLVVFGSFEVLLFSFALLRRQKTQGS